MLEIRLFGPTEILHDGRLVAKPARAPERRLLAWLALHNGPAQRSAIAADLWPTFAASGGAGRQNVKSALFSLKRAIPPEVWEEHFVADRDTIGLRADRDVVVDVRRAEEHLRGGRREEAAGLVRGDLLEGVDEPWANRLREEHAQVLALGPKTGTRRRSSAGPGRRRLLLASPIAALAVMLGFLVWPDEGERDDRQPRACPPNLTAADPPGDAPPMAFGDDGSPRPQDGVDVGLRPAALATSREGIWVAERQGIALIDPDRRRQVGAAVDIGGSVDRPNRAAYAIAVARSRLWVTRRDGVLVSVDRATRRRVGRQIRYGRGAGDVAVGGGAVWVNNFDDGFDGMVTRIDPCTGRMRRIRVGREADTVKAGHGSIWVSDAANGTVVRLDGRGRIVATIPGFIDPQDVGIADDAVWVIEYAEQSMRQIDPETNRPAGRRIRIGPDPAGITFTDGAVWTAHYGNGTLTRVDRRSLRARRGAVRVGIAPTDVLAAHGRLWIPDNNGDTVTPVGP